MEGLWKGGRVKKSLNISNHQRIGLKKGQYEERGYQNHKKIAMVFYGLSLTFANFKTFWNE